MTTLTDPLHLIGTVLADKYEVQALAGEGGFSVVYDRCARPSKRRVIRGARSMGDTRFG